MRQSPAARDPPTANNWRSQKCSFASFFLPVEHSPLAMGFAMGEKCKNALVLRDGGSTNDRGT